MSSEGSASPGQNSLTGCPISSVEFVEVIQNVMWFKQSKKYDKYHYNQACKAELESIFIVPIFYIWCL